VAQVLGTLADQDAPKDAYEVLVVDNASPADITGAVAPFFGRVPGLRCIREEQVGLSHARNRGYREARGEYVAYVDDDCKLPREWVSVALDIIQNIRPTIFGGPYRAFYMTPKPRWYKDEYGSYSLSTFARPLTGNEFLIGLNMVIHREKLANLGGFRPDLGMSGAQLAYGEETELQMRIRSEYPDASIWYDPRFWVYHLVRPEKMTVQWLVRHRIADGAYYARISPGRLGNKVSPGRIALAFVRAVGGLAWGPIRGGVFRHRERFPFYMNYFYEQNSHNLFDLGYALETARIAARHWRQGSCKPPYQSCS